MRTESKGECVEDKTCHSISRGSVLATCDRPPDDSAIADGGRGAFLEVRADTDMNIIIHQQALGNLVQL